MGTTTARPASTTAAPATRRRRRLWPIIVAVIVAALVALVLLWDWNWFRPIVEARASTALGRKVTLGHLDVRLSRHPTVILDDLEVANPDGFGEAAPYLAHVGRLSVTADAMAYLRRRAVVLEHIDVQRPDAHAIRLPDGRTNYAFDLPQSKPAAADAKPAPELQIGDITIADGTGHVVDPKLKADFQLKVATRDGADHGHPQIVAEADGTYAGQPITGNAIGGGLLSLRDASEPYPVEAHVANGPTKLDLTGTVRDPLHFAGTDLKLHLAGPDMSLLMPLTGIPLPKTPPFDIAGNLDYAARKIRLTNFAGRLGSSDISGTIAVDPTGGRPVVDADLASRKVDLADLGGLIGSQPGRQNTPGQSAEQKQAVRKAEASSQLIPNAPINLPKLQAADVHVRYKGASIAGRGVPFDSLSVNADIVNGAVKLHPVALGVGRGSIAGDIALTPVDRGDLHAQADIRFDHVDIGRMLGKAGVNGAGLLGGRADIDTTGNSLAAFLGRGNGNVRLLMAGGDLSALLVDLSGLEFGNALLSALGVPNRARLQCFVADLGLDRGTLASRTLLVVTSEADLVVSGSVDLTRERLNMRLRTDARHFSVGSLPTDIGIGGTFKSPSIMPNVGELAGRGGAAVGLGILLTPLGALLPTVQFGTGDDNANVCAATVHSFGKKTTTESAAAPPAPKAPAKATAKTKGKSPTRKAR